MASDILNTLTGMIPMYVNMLVRHTIGVEQIPADIREAAVAAYEERYAKLIEAEKEKNEADVAEASLQADDPMEVSGQSLVSTDEAPAVIDGTPTVVVAKADKKKKS